MFSWLEKNPFFFTIAFLAVFSVAGIVEVIPSFTKAARPIEGLRPYTVLELAGRHVYIKEGCANCHSQVIRPFQSEVDRYGSYSLSGEYAYDRPFLWGSKRTGPDLHRVGDYRTTDWHAHHMWDPKSVVPDSIMPSYKHLYKKMADFDTAYSDAYTNKTIFAVPYDIPNGVALGTYAEAKKLYEEQAKQIVADMKNPLVSKAYEQGEVTEIVALIAYLNRLGTARVTEPEVAQGE
ncbi:MAG: cytochrome-c oxidase, cbb3-type subunit II [Helicobacter sp.]|nr:cytochrome-c oxidase, cbb3-type subunit II [Helicobacter sp.]